MFAVIDSATGATLSTHMEGSTEMTSSKANDSLKHEIVIFWNGALVFEGRCTVVMGYEVAARMREDFVSYREYGDPLTLDSFLSTRVGSQIQGTIDDEKPGKVRTGLVHWRFTNHGD